MIKIICVGKLKENYWRDASQEYLKRLTKYSNIKLIEIPDCSIDDPVVSLNKEKDLILKHIKPNEYLILLDVKSKQYSSENFSNKLNSILLQNSNITFLIGGSYGIHHEIKDLASLKISFSEMTFPHQLFRVMFLEQLYRAYKIMNNEKYHK